MATLSANKTYYENYDWSAGGEEWSEPWGGTRSMWLASIYPRICDYLPAGSIVEIGSGHGRIARILHAFATRRLLLFDIVDDCVAACEHKFSTSAKTQCHKTDGKSLAGVDDHSVDLVFSFYSLVGADRDTIGGYLAEIDRVLSDDGVAFIHHSNAGMYFDPEQAEPDKRLLLLAAYRDMTIDAAEVQTLVRRHNLACVRQECINWDISEILSDCFSTITRPASKWFQEPVVTKNFEFQQEQAAAKSREHARGANRPGRAR